MRRKQSKRERLVRELVAIRNVQAEKPLWFRAEDYARLSKEWNAKSAELVELLVSARMKRNRRILGK
jgi:hypothetical protein